MSTKPKGFFSRVFREATKMIDSEGLPGDVAYMLALRKVEEEVESGDSPLLIAEGNDIGVALQKQADRQAVRKRLLKEHDKSLARGGAHA